MQIWGTEKLQLNEQLPDSKVGYENNSQSCLLNGCYKHALIF